jgi:molybdate transport system ATP-binding protein
VALARALAREPAVLLLDEPFAAVDRSVRRRLQAEIDSLRRTLHVPLILVTHDFDDVVRLATHVLLLEHGRTVARGPLPTLTSRPDLPWLREAVGLGSVFDAMVSRVDASRGLAELTFDGGTLLVPAPHLTLNLAVRVRIPAREIILATNAPTGLSLHNVLPGTVSALHGDTTFDLAVVQLTVGRLLLLAEVTRDAVEKLNIGVGRDLHALIKSVSIEVLTPDISAAEPSR